MDKFAQLIHQFNETAGRLVGWLVVLLVCLTFYDVVMRYLFNAGSIGLQELEWHLFSLIILLGAAYTLKHREHVRVDILYASRLLNDRHRAIIDLFGNLVFLIPFCCLLIWSSIPFVEDAFVYAERSPDPGGLPYRWLLKASIPVGFFLLACQGVADSIDTWRFLRTSET